MRTLFHRPRITTPSLVGKHLYEAFALLSNADLSPKLLDQKVDPDLPEGTIISQIPDPGQPIKKQQTVFLVLSKKPPITPAPHLIGKSKQEILALGKKLGCKVKLYEVHSTYPRNQCIAQIPQPNEPIKHNTLIAYIAHTPAMPFIWPDFINKPIDQVVAFLEQYEITPEINPENYRSRARVIDQRPLAGSFVSLSEDQLPYVHLHVR